MKIKKVHNKMLVIVIVLLAMMGLTALLIHTFLGNNATDNTSKNRDSQSDNKQSQNLENNPDIKEIPVNTDHPQKNVPGSNGKKTVGMVASGEVASDTVFIRGGVNGVVDTGGACFAQLSGPYGEVKRKDTALLQNPSTTDCKTISFPSSELSSGTWKFTLNYSSSDTEGVSNEIKLTIP